MSKKIIADNNTGHCINCTLWNVTECRYLAKLLELDDCVDNSGFQLIDDKEPELRKEIEQMRQDKAELMEALIDSLLMIEWYERNKINRNGIGTSVENIPKRYHKIKAVIEKITGKPLEEVEK